jgi:hypothetical protein
LPDASPSVGRCAAPGSISAVCGEISIESVACPYKTQLLPPQLPPHGELPPVAGLLRRAPCSSARLCSHCAAAGDGTTTVVVLARSLHHLTSRAVDPPWPHLGDLGCGQLLDSSSDAAMNPAALLPWRSAPCVPALLEPDRRHMMCPSGPPAQTVRPSRLSGHDTRARTYSSGL